MCSIIEAWGDNDFAQLTGRAAMPVAPSANEASMNGVRTNQMAMDQQRSARQSTDLSAIRAMSMYPQPDQVGQPVSWADNRRQYAQPANELLNINSGEPATDTNMGGGWQTAYCKPRPDMNSMTRGVHSRYSREKRFDAQTAELPYGGQLTTDINPAMITGDARPGYLDLYSTGYEGRKWMPNMTTTTTRPAMAGNARPEAAINPPTTTTGYSKRQPSTTTTRTSGPMAANDIPEQFMELSAEFQQQPEEIKSPFTEEVITDPRLVAQNLAARAEQLQALSDQNLAARAEQLQRASTGVVANNQSVNNKVNPVPDEIQAIRVQLNSLVAKMNNLEQKVSYVENNKSHDIILFIVIAIFILFVLDNVFKLGKFS
jgi:hypothetical protein